MADTAALTVTDLSVRFGSHVALDRVSFTVPRGCLVGVVGPNGAGKSTLFRAILGLAPATGTVTLADPGAAFVPQGDHTPRDFPATALDVALMGRFDRRRWWQRLSRDDRHAAMDSLAQVGMAEHAGCTYATLSGGQRQRVILARALANDRTVILLDEPMTGVDATSRTAISGAIGTLRDQGRTLLMSTHDLNDAARTCDRLMFLNRRLVAYGPPADTFTPAVIQSTYAGAAVMLTDRDGTVFGVLDDAHHDHDHGSDSSAHAHHDHAEHHS